MSEIQSANHFGSAQSTLDISRSRFSRDFENILTLKAGDLVPLYWDEVLPGDTYQIGYNFVLRMLTPVVPIMDNAFIDIYAFYVPDRVLCDKYNLCNTNAGTPSSTKPSNVDFETFMGANKSGYWSNSAETYLNTYVLPCVAPQSVANYLGLPVGNGSVSTTSISGASLNQLVLYRYDGSDFSDYFNNPVVSGGSTYNYIYCPQSSVTSPGYTRVNGLPFATLDFIFNEWFRNENLQAPTQYLVTGNLTYYSTSATSSAGSFILGSQLCSGNDDSYISNNVISSTTPSTSTTTKYSYPYKVTKFADYFTSALPAPQKGDAVSLSIGDSASVTGSDDYIPISVNTDSSLILSSNTGFVPGIFNTSSYSIAGGMDVGTLQLDLNGDYLDVISSSSSSSGVKSSTIADSLTVDLANATAVTVNALRTAFATQKFFESLARSGTRYVEILKGLFGTAPDDSTLDRPEYLGGKRVPIVISQVTQTAQTAEGDLGEMGAFSNTVGRDQYLVSKSFKEHGIIMVVGCIRTAQKYFQGIPRKFTRYRQLDYYFPVFANLGEQAVKKSELYLSPMATTSLNQDVFGYQEAWAEYRYNPDRLTGFVDPCAGDATLSSWTFQNKMSAIPVLNSEFDTQDYDSIGNVLYDTTTISQFLMDIGFDVKTTRPMPVYSIPGLIDHH